MTERLELRPKRLNLILAVLGALGFVLIGLWMMLAEDSDIFVRGAGALAAAFFGYAGYFAVRALIEPRGLTLTPEALTWRGPTFAPKTIPWEEIAATGVLSQNGQAFNVIVLKDPAPLIARFSPAEATATCRSMRTLLRFAQLAVPLAPGDSADLIKIARKGRADTLEELFAFLRAFYGGEILLGWADRDRSAPDLDALLRRYLPAV